MKLVVVLALFALMVFSLPVYAGGYAVNASLSAGLPPITGGCGTTASALYSQQSLQVDPYQQAALQQQFLQQQLLQQQSCSLHSGFRAPIAPVVPVVPALDLNIGAFGGGLRGGFFHRQRFAFRGRF